MRLRPRSKKPNPRNTAAARLMYGRDKIIESLFNPEANSVSIHTLAYRQWAEI